MQVRHFGRMLIYRYETFRKSDPHIMLRPGFRLLHRLSRARNINRYPSQLGKNCCSRWHLTSEEKPLFSLDVDLSQFEEKDGSESQDLKSQENQQSTSTPDSELQTFTDQVLADFVLHTKSQPNPLDQILDKMSNEDLSDLDHLKAAAHTRSVGATSEDAPEPVEDSDSIQKEKSLFDEIFARYSTENTEKQKEQWRFDLSDQVLSTLQESFSKASSTKATSVSTEEQELEKMAASALMKTTEYVSGIKSSQDLMLFCQTLFLRYTNEDFDKSTFYLRKQRHESSSDFAERQKEVCRAIEANSNEFPENPVLTSQTMPIIFNSILETFMTKYYDAASALTLFNLAKEDLALYTVVCNQTTYNKMLVAYWIFYGKASLYEVELLVVEMMNNGFNGDLETFAILKEILMSYHTIRMGKTIYNPNGMPIWSREDEKRAANLGTKLQKIGRLFLR